MKTLSERRWVARCACAVTVVFALVAAAAPARDVVATVVDVQADDRTVTIIAMGRERVMPVASGTRILDAEGKPLAEGLRSAELKSGVTITVTVEAVGDNPVITAIRLGRHAVEPTPPPGRPSVGLKPLTEMSATDTYKGEDGGLYGGGSNEPPAGHLEAVKAATAKITPLNVDGEPATDGRIGLVSISMSNGTLEFSTFKRLADADERKSPRVVIVDCAQNGQAMAQWVDPEARAWVEADRRLAAASLGARQVQVLWVKLANAQPTGDLAEHGRKLYDHTLAVLHNAKKRFPNARVAYLASRIYAGYSDGPLNPEPYAYEGAFAARWLIRDQIKGAAPLRHEAGDQPARVPVLLWGPYLWADGTTSRKVDGLTWQRQDLAFDGVHPTESGRLKVAEMLLSHFTTDALAKTWFARR